MSRTNKEHAPTRRQTEALEKRRRILDTALRMIRKGGFHAVSVDAITQVAGVAKGTFYVHFRTKEDLVRECCSVPFDELGRRARASQGSLTERLSAFFHAHARLSEEQGLEICREWFRIAVSPEEAVKLGLEAYSRDRKVILSFLKDAVKGGELTSGAPVNTLADLLVARLYGMTATWCMSNGTCRPTAQSKRLVRLELAALLAQFLSNP